MTLARTINRALHAAARARARHAWAAAIESADRWARETIAAHRGQPVAAPFVEAIEALSSEPAKPVDVVDVAAVEQSDGSIRIDLPPRR